MNAHNSYERRKDKVPAYFVTDFGVLKEADMGQEGQRPLYWRPAPLPEERLLELKQKSKNPLEFARLIEEEIFR